MGDDVRGAILQRFSACLSPFSIREEAPGYTREPMDNLLPTLLSDEALLLDFATGDGKELAGDPPSFCAAHSSAALVANTFGPYRSRPDLLRLAGIGGFTHARFERKLPTGLKGTPPNLDFVAWGPSGLVAVEGKFTETFGSKEADFASSYQGAVERLAEEPWADMYRSLVEDPRRFRYLDAAQLVKHYLGMRNSLADQEGSLVLLYLFWEPSNAGVVPQCLAHREEAEGFAGAVAGSRIRFEVLSYPELWTQWAEADGWDGGLQHVGALRARYGLPLPVAGA